MYKSFLAASITAIVAYFFFASPQLQSYLQSSVDSVKNKSLYSTMAVSSVSRTVTKKVFAVEQSEVRFFMHEGA